MNWRIASRSGRQAAGEKATGRTFYAPVGERVEREHLHARRCVEEVRQLGVDEHERDVGAGNAAGASGRRTPRSNRGRIGSGSDDRGATEPDRLERGGRGAVDVEPSTPTWVPGPTPWPASTSAIALASSWSCDHSTRSAVSPPAAEPTKVTDPGAVAAVSRPRRQRHPRSDPLDAPRGYFSVTVAAGSRKNTDRATMTSAPASRARANAAPLVDTRAERTRRARGSGCAEPGYRSTMAGEVDDHDVGVVAPQSRHGRTARRQRLLTYLGSVHEVVDEGDDPHQPLTGIEAGRRRRRTRANVCATCRQLVHQLDARRGRRHRAGLDPTVGDHSLHHLAPGVGAHDRERPVVVLPDAAGGDVGVLRGEVGAALAPLTGPGVALLQRISW